MASHRRYERAEYPDLKERFGEDPARFLDHPKVGADIGSTPSIGIAVVRIRGITDLELLHEWKRVAREVDAPKKALTELRKRETELIEERRERWRVAAVDRMRHEGRVRDALSDEVSRETPSQDVVGACNVRIDELAAEENEENEAQADDENDARTAVTAD